MAFSNPSKAAGIFFSFLQFDGKGKERGLLILLFR